MLEAEFRLGTAPAAPVAEPLALTDALRDECLARARVYRLLSGVFVEEPGPAFVAALREPQSLADLTEAGLRFDGDFLDAAPDALNEALACEYTALFIATGGFPPVESARLTGRYKQDPYFQVLAAYRRAGFALGRGRFEVFPDQLGVELMYLAELLERSAAAVDAGDAVLYRKLEREIKRFWSLHIGRWVRGYCQLIAQTAHHSFYREMARFLHGFAEEEIAALELKRLEDLDQGRAVVPKSEIKLEFNPDEPVCGACPSGRAEGQAQVQPLHDLRR
jgi:TorA maturation chaperone TorD